MHLKDFLAALDQNKITQEIAEAEKKTSGEIRIHIQPRAHGDIRYVGERTFERLGMTKTALRNGVLLFIACEEQRFVILGDEGINAVVPDGFWDDIAAKLTIHFKAHEITEGIVEAVHQVADALRHYFPRAADDINELTNEINIEQ
jgi:uncharacterized membrane protein